MGAKALSLKVGSTSRKSGPHGTKSRLYRKIVPRKTLGRATQGKACHRVPGMLAGSHGLLGARQDQVHRGLVGLLPHYRAKPLTLIF